MPDVPGHALESVLEPVGMVLVVDTDGSHVIDSADEGQSDPAGKCATTVKLVSQIALDAPKCSSSTYISPYASGSDCVESPITIILRFGSHELIFFMRSALYSSVPIVRAESRPATVFQLKSRRMSVPGGKYFSRNSLRNGYRLYGEAER